MSTVVNDRDVLLQGASTRLAALAQSLTWQLTKESHIVPADSAGNVTSYAGATGDFKVNKGSADVSSNFSLSTVSNPQALTIGYTGQTFTVTAGLSAGVDSAVVTIRATGSGLYAGITLDKVFTLAKAKTGATGATGSTGSTGASGPRGSVTVSGSGSVWSDTTANNAITTFTGSATKITGDIATISNGTNFAETRYWDGTAWVSFVAKFAGNVLVQGTVTTDRLVANAATAASASVATNLSISASSGSVGVTFGVPSGALSLTTTGAPVKILATLSITNYTGISSGVSPSIAYLQAYLMVDGVTTGSISDAAMTPFRFVSALPRFESFGNISLVWRRTDLAAGAHTFAISTTVIWYDSSGVAIAFGTGAQLICDFSLIVEENKV